MEHHVCRVQRIVFFLAFVLSFVLSFVRSSVVAVVVAGMDWWCIHAQLLLVSEQPQHTHTQVLNRPLARSIARSLTLNSAWARALALSASTFSRMASWYCSWRRREASWNSSGCVTPRLVVGRGSAWTVPVRTHHPSIIHPFQHPLVHVYTCTRVLGVHHSSRQACSRGSAPAGT